MLPSEATETTETTGATSDTTVEGEQAVPSAVDAGQNGPARAAPPVTARRSAPWRCSSPRSARASWAVRSRPVARPDGHTVRT